MSALIFVRDGRTLPYVPVTIAALDAVRATCEMPRKGGERRSYPHALATYMALLELANNDRADRVAVTQRDLSEKAMASRSTIQAALGDLEEAGVVVKREQIHGRARVENEYVVVEPCLPDGGAQEVAPPPAKNAGVASEKSILMRAQPSQPSAAQAVIQTAEKNGKKDVPGDGIQRQVNGEQRTVIEIFDYWRRRCAHPTAKPTRERREKVAARLRDGYTVEQIRTGIDGAARGAFVNDSGKRFDDLELICRTGSKLESFIDRAAPAVANGGNVHPIRRGNGRPQTSGDLLAASLARRQAAADTIEGTAHELH
jgi:hypothetical protein